MACCWLNWVEQVCRMLSVRTLRGHLCVQVVHMWTVSMTLGPSSAQKHDLTGPRDICVVAKSFAGRSCKSTVLSGEKTSRCCQADFVEIKLHLASHPVT